MRCDSNLMPNPPLAARSLPQRIFFERLHAAPLCKMGVATKCPVTGLLLTYSADAYWIDSKTCARGEIVS